MASGGVSEFVRRWRLWFCLVMSVVQASPQVRKGMWMVREIGTVAVREVVDDEEESAGGQRMSFVPARALVEARTTHAPSETSRCPSAI